MITVRLKELRTNKGLTQKEVGDMLGFSNQRYNYYETGKREPHNETLKKLADYFEVSIDYLLGTTDNPSVVQHQDLPTSEGKATIRINPYGGTKKTVQVSIEKLKEIEAMLESLED